MGFGRTARRRIGRIVGVVAGLVGLVAATANRWMVAWWDVQASRPVGVAERRDLEECRYPGTAGTLRLYRQALEVPCPPVVVAAWGVRARTRVGVRRWWADAWDGEVPGPRTALRLELVRWLSGEPVAATLSARLEDPALPAPEAGWGLGAVARGEIAGPWIDPVLRYRAVLWSARRDVPADLSRVIEALDAAAVAPGLVEGVEGGIVAAALAERAVAWGPPGPLPAACVGDGCLGVARETLGRVLAGARRGWDGGPVEVGEVAEAAPMPLADALWQARGGSARVTRGRRLLGAVARWIRNQPDPAEALVAAVASPFSSYGVPEAVAGEIGDPAAVVGRRRGSPWGTAVAALVLGEAAGVPVSAKAVGDDVLLEIGVHRVRVGPCGRRGDGDGEGMPVAPRSAVARAAMEAAGVALSVGDGAQARRLAALAERADPGWAAGAAEAIAPVSGPAATIGARVGGLAPEPAGWRWWVEARRGAGGLACPPPPRPEPPSADHPG